MRTHNTRRSTPDRIDTAFAGVDSTTSEPKSASIHFLNSSTRLEEHRSTRMPPALQNDVVQLLADIDGLSILVRFLVKDMPAAMQSDFGSKGADIHSLLLSKLQKMVDRMRGCSLRSGDRSKAPRTIAKLISSEAALAQLPASPNETVLRVGPLELDLLDRTATRGDRQIDLRPREFRLLKYMMERSDTFLTRATLLKEVWHYKFVPKTNLVDVHMGRLRRKVDGPNEAPMIHNTRGVGFILTATPLPRASSSRPAERSDNPAVA
jgi:DNA-binding winged helix-turn-helix (wHTH) protein